METKRKKNEKTLDYFAFSDKRILHNQKVFVILRANYEL